MSQWLQKTIAAIKPADQEALEKAQLHLDGLLKPLGSLGKLEEIAVKLAGITGYVHNHIERRCMVVMAADNGICQEGVSCTPQDITSIQAVNMTKGICGIGVLSRFANADLRVIDIGMARDCSGSAVIDRHVRRGTGNFARGPAMTRAEAEQALRVGIEVVEEIVKEGYQVIGTGEMGIGNTSSTSACLMALTGLSAENAVGKGGGLSEAGLAHKKDILTKALDYNRPNRDDPLDVLAKVGGFDIGGLTGCFLGAAYFRKPILIDGVISALAALIAVRLNPLTGNFMFATHRSKEPAYDYIMREIGLAPMLDLDMRLGEGTGCAIAFPIFSAACAIMNDMASFSDIAYDESYRVDLREISCTGF